MNNKHKAIFASVFLGLGTNLGNRKRNMELALENIEKQIGTIIAQSAFYDSEPFGFESDNLFLNSVVKVSTQLTPYELLAKTQLIEREMGRTNKTDVTGYSDRVIDIDIIFYNTEVIDNAPRLVVPHPEMQKRDFVLKPLSEIAPHFVHPVLNRSINDLANSL